MILRIILFITIIFSQETVGNWQSFSSFHTLKSCKIFNDREIACLADGGISLFNFNDYSSRFITENEGLTKSKYDNFEIDKYKNIWIPSKSDGIRIDLWSIDQAKLLKPFNFNISNIHHLFSDSLNLVGVYQNLDEIGIMHFVFGENNWDYKDYYLNFGESINEIYDLKIQGEFIFILTNLGLYKGNIHSNLKNSINWELVEVINEESYFVEGELLQWHNQNSIFTKKDETQLVQLELDISNIKNVIYSDSIFIITNNEFYIFDSTELIFNYSNSFSSNFIDLNIALDKIYISIEKHGILEFSIYNIENPIFFPIPSTILNSEFTAITVLEDNRLVGVGINGLSFFDGFSWLNFYPHSSNYEYDPDVFNNFNLNYKLSNGGDGSIFPSWSIVESNPNSLMFGNTQIIPNNPGYAGALIEYNIETKELAVFDTTNQVLDGFDGIFNSGWNSRNLLVNQIKVDPYGNTWVLNPYAETDSNIIAIRPKNQNNWVHIKAPENGVYFMPTEIDFDSQGRVWVAFEDRTSMENLPYSDGGLMVILLTGDLSGDFNYYWRDISNIDILPNMSVWSIAIDKQDFIWLLTSAGIQGYSTLSNSLVLNPVYLIDFYTYLPLFRGDHIRVDNQDNKWISTRHSGVKVILENTQYWPTVDGFTSENSGLLSNIVNDIAFDEKNGFVWFAADLGLSRYEYPITTSYVKNSSLLFHPNPFYVPEENEILIEGCFPNSTVIINDISGKHIKTLKALYLGEESSQILWNGKDKYGLFVESGIYLISSQSETGEIKRGKLAIIKQ